MLKENDKVVCLDLSSIKTRTEPNCYDSVVANLELYGVYTISKIMNNTKHNHLHLDGLGGMYYLSKRFISLTEHRKMKINNLLNKE